MKLERELIVLSPFEVPNVRLILETIKTGATGILHLGVDRIVAKESLTTLAQKTQKFFGVCISSFVPDFELPKNVTKIIAPFGCDLKGLKANEYTEILYQVHSPEEAEKAIKQKVSSIIIKGSESAGKISKYSSFDIFRKIIDKAQKKNINVYIQGGVGVHTSAAFLALGAKGIIFDSQVALFPECNIQPELKALMKDWKEDETQVIEHFRMLKPNPKFPGILPEQLAVGQDACLAADFAERYKNLRRWIAAVYEAAYGHLRQAKNRTIIDYGKSTGTANVENGEANSLLPNLLLWEKQIARMLLKEKNLSKFTLMLPVDVSDSFFGAFASIMAASVAAKGIKTGISASTGSPSKEVVQKEVRELLSGLNDIPPIASEVEPLDIAVIGMDCIYPGATDINEYWKNILSAKDCVTEVSASHWDKELFYMPNSNDTDYSVSKWGGFIPDTDFDPMEFGLVPQSLFMIETSHLAALLASKRALENAGYGNLSEHDFENTSVFFGASGGCDRVMSGVSARYEVKQTLGELPDDLNELLPRANEYTFQGLLTNIITGRIANRLNLGGRNYTVDAACTSSLAAFDIACRDLRAYRSDMVILGGVDTHNTKNAFLMFSSTRVLSAKGYCAPFDANADGIAMGEGVGVLILKRLEDAERDGNKIYAVIKGVEGSSDGRNFSVVAPSRKGQTLALERAYRTAGIFPSQAGMIEAHGTGTVVGDKIELAALTDLFLDAGALPKQTYIGSVKSQIGHTKSAAGTAGLIKAILSVYHGVVPPTIHLDDVNHFYDPENSPFVFNKRAGLWAGDRRIAGVSSFGFGGSNFHAVIENYPSGNFPVSACEMWISELYVFRGDTFDEAKALMQKIIELLSPQNRLIRLVDIAYSLAVYNNKKIQVSIVAGSKEELLAKINAVLNGRMEFQIYHRKEKEGKVAFLFPGQGSQYVNMARDLFVAFPAMRRLLNKHSEYIRIIFPETAFDKATIKAQEEAITDTRNAQPLLGIVELAIAEQLRFLGIEPDMVVGHSYGELPALCFAGVIAADDLVGLSKERANAIIDIAEKNKGKLVAAILTEEELAPLMENETEVWAVNYNSSKQIVVGGTIQGIKSFMKKAVAKNIFCTEINVNCAFHSPLLDGVEKTLESILEKYTFKAPKIPVWDNMSAGTYPSKHREIKTNMAKHPAKPILFSKQVENMYDAGARIFIETGPGRVLLGLVEATLGKKCLTIQTENKNSEGVSYWLRALAQYLASGKIFDIEKLFEGRNVKFIQIDNPEQYKKSVTNWTFNGNEAHPSGKNILADQKIQLVG